MGNPAGGPRDASGSGTPKWKVVDKNYMLGCGPLTPRRGFLALKKRVRVYGGKLDNEDVMVNRVEGTLLPRGGPFL